MLVVDAMTGQDAVNAASAFDEALGIDSVLISSWTATPGAVPPLSVRAVTGKPIKFCGTGEKLGLWSPSTPTAWLPACWAWEM